MQKRVIIVTLEQRLGVARLPAVLRRAGCLTTILGETSSAVCWSRYVDEIVPSSADPVQLAEHLKTLPLQHRGANPRVIIGDETSLLALARFRDQKWIRDIFPFDLTGDTFEIAMRKTAFTAAAIRAGLPMPRSRVCYCRQDVQQAAAELQFPLYIKRDMGVAGHGVAQISEPARIYEAFARFGKFGPVVVQETAPGIIGHSEIIYVRGRPLKWVHFVAPKTFPGKLGPSSVRRYLNHSQLDDIVRGVGRLTGFHGLCGLDWIYDSVTNSSVVIEFNPRVTPGIHLTRRIGADFTDALETFLNHNPGQIEYPAEPEHEATVRFDSSASRELTIHLFPQDLRRCLCERDVRGLLRWLPFASRKDIPWHDPSLLAYFVWDILRDGVPLLKKISLPRPIGLNVPTSASPVPVPAMRRAS